MDIKDIFVMHMLIVRDHVLGTLDGILIKNMATMDPFFAEVDELVSRLIIGAFVSKDKDNYGGKFLVEAGAGVCCPNKIDV